MKTNKNRAMTTLFPDTFGHLVNNFFNDYVDEVNVDRAFKPSSDISETNSHYEVAVSLPGLKKEDIKIELDNNYLTVRGESKKVSESDDKKTHLREITYGKFTRKFYLPENVDVESIDARFEDGILNVSIAKLEEKKPRLISVK